MYEIDKILVENIAYFVRRLVNCVLGLKVQMGYKMCTPGVQNSLGYRITKWGTVGSPVWDNITTTFSCKSAMFEINIQLNDAGAYLFSETATNFTLTASHPTRVNGTVKITVDRVGYGEGCTSNINVILGLPSTYELLGASVNITCKNTVI